MILKAVTFLAGLCFAGAALADAPEDYRRMQYTEPCGYLPSLDQGLVKQLQEQPIWRTNFPESVALARILGEGGHVLPFIARDLAAEQSKAQVKQKYGREVGQSVMGVQMRRYIRGNSSAGTPTTPKSALLGERGDNLFEMMELNAVYLNVISALLGDGIPARKRRDANLAINNGWLALSRLEAKHAADIVRITMIQGETPLGRDEAAAFVCLANAVEGLFTYRIETDVRAVDLNTLANAMLRSAARWGALSGGKDAGATAAETYSEPELELYWKAGDVLAKTATKAANASTPDRPPGDQVLRKIYGRLQASIASRAALLLEINAGSSRP